MSAERRDVRAADVRSLVTTRVVRTPLLRASSSERPVFVKCENLQVTGSFKVRGAIGALLGAREASPELWEAMGRDGVVTASSGNFAQGMAYATAMLGMRLTVLVPEGADPYKVDRIRRFDAGARVVEVPYDTWRDVMITSRSEEHAGVFVSSEADPGATIGTATLAYEIVEQLPAVDAVLVPYGGGGLTYSLADALARLRPGVPVYAVEVSTGAPFGASLAAGRPVEVEYTRTWVDGIGASFVLPWQFERLQGLVAGAFTVCPEEVADAASALLFDEHLLVEGAGAVAYAAARANAPAFGWRAPCAVLTGGVVDPAVALDLVRAPVRADHARVLACVA